MTGWRRRIQDGARFGARWVIGLLPGAERSDMARAQLDEGFQRVGARSANTPDIGTGNLGFRVVVA